VNSHHAPKIREGMVFTPRKSRCNGKAASIPKTKDLRLGKRQSEKGLGKKVKGIGREENSVKAGKSDGQRGKKGNNGSAVQWRYPREKKQQMKKKRSKVEVTLNKLGRPKDQALKYSESVKSVPQRWANMTEKPVTNRRQRITTRRISREEMHRACFQKECVKVHRTGEKGRNLKGKGEGLDQTWVHQNQKQLEPGIGPKRRETIHWEGGDISHEWFNTPVVKRGPTKEGPRIGKTRDGKPLWGRQKPSQRGGRATSAGKGKEKDRPTPAKIRQKKRGEEDDPKNGGLAIGGAAE